MEYVHIPDTDLTVSRVALGTWAIGGWMWGGSDEREGIATIHAALDAGVTLIDTAPVYGFGRSEEIVGKALKEYGRRDRVHISTKVALAWKDGQVSRDASPARIEAEVEDSLRRLGVETIDIYFVHWPDGKVPFEETAAALERLRLSGKVRCLGVSNYDPAQMEAFRGRARLSFCQPPYNLFERDMETAILPYCKRHDVALMTYGALCRGLLSGTMGPDREFTGDDLRRFDPKFAMPRFGQYLGAAGALAAWAKERHGKELLPFAVRWVLDQGVEVALWGGRRPAQMAPIGDIFDFALTAADFEAVNRILAEHVTDPVGPQFMAPPE
ncbi:aldo/keto reductase [Desulfovibrio sp. JY]|nr:aldo/keto reductase [Desulfovibrio sp. JY]